MIDSSQVGLIFLNIHKGDLTMRITSSKILGILLALAMMMAARCYPVYASDDIGVGLRGPTRLFVVEWWTESFGPYSGSVTGYAY